MKAIQSGTIDLSADGLKITGAKVSYVVKDSASSSISQTDSTLSITPISAN
jgi:hypothetical protein